MNTQLVTQRVRIAQWNERFHEKNELGLSVDEFCERNNVSKNMYFYWLRKCKAEAISNAGDTFAELLSPEAINQVPAEFIPEAMIEINGLKVGVSSGTSRELLEMITEVSRNA